MSWQIPTQIEQDIIAGKAQYRTFQTGVGGQSILPVPPNAYAVIFGFDFSPAGGGLIDVNLSGISTGPVLIGSATLKYFETQQISFYTGQDFFPFIFHVDINTQRVVRTTDPITGAVTGYADVNTINNTPLSRQVYITASSDVTITHGLITTAAVATLNAIPQTNRTPALLTYGGSPQAIATQTDFGPAATPVQFMQPSPKDYEAFAFGLLPNGANNQAFATPDITRGLRDTTQLINSIVPAWNSVAGIHYFLNLHYAIYTRTIPEQRG
jgi:hypothetical protein